MDKKSHFLWRIITNGKCTEFFFLGLDGSEEVWRAPGLSFVHNDSWSRMEESVIFGEMGNGSSILGVMI